MSSRSRQPAVTASEGLSGADEALRAARVRRSAWVLGLLAVAFYVGFIVWSAIRGPV
jgi:hypothetical protein